MNHLDQERLILHYYGEEGETPAAALHLEECAECRALYASIQRVLNVVESLPVPEPEADYGAQVWQRIERQLPVRRRWSLPAPWRWAGAAAAFASLLVAAFLMGRFYPQGRRPETTAAADAQAGERVLLVAVGDYLERSQMILIELGNARPAGPLDISSEQARAEDLVGETRLYRQTAAHKGDVAVAGVLDELEHVLLDIAHAPSQASPEELEKLRQRFESEGILFKIRVLGSNVRNREAPGPGSSPAVRREL